MNFYSNFMFNFAILPSFLKIIPLFLLCTTITRMPPQCDDGGDEKNCKYIYKQKRLTKLSGTKPCHHLHYGPGNKINKPEVWILALSCDGGDPECYGGIDEMCDPLLNRLELCKSF